jgi:hypothetical protein
VEIGTEAAQFLEKEYINGILVAVYWTVYRSGFSYLVSRQTIAKVQ